MDKLPEPELGVDKNFPRKKTGIEPYVEKSNRKFLMYFATLSCLSIYRYWREIYFYEKKPTIFIIVPFFLFSSYNISKFIADDAFIYAAIRNNKEEDEFKTEYAKLYKEAKLKNIHVPDDLLI